MTDTPQTPEDEDETSLLDLLQIILDNLRLLVLLPLAIGLTTLGISFIMKPTFTAEVTFLPPQQQGMAAGMLASLGGLGGLGSLAGAAAGIKNPADQFVAFLQSRSLQDALIDKYQLMDRYEVDYRKDMYELMEKKYISISAGKKDGIIKVEVDDKDPQFAADLANAHVTELGILLDRLAVTDAQQRRQFFEKQLALTKEELIKAEQALRKIGISADILKANPASAVATVAALQAQLTAQQVKIGNMRGYLAETSQEFKQALKELASIRTQLEKAEQFDAKSGNTDAYINRYRDFKYQETLFELYAKQFELARADEAREGANIQVVDTAVAPDKKSKPKRSIMAIVATLLSGLILLIYVFVKRASSQALQNPETYSKVQSLRQAWRKAVGRQA